MAAPRNAESEEEGRVELRTLVIASGASAAAAAVTSQLWIAGTWIAAAVTPVLVALISEAMHRPTERMARATRSRTAVRSRPAAAEPGPVRVYRQPAARSRRRRFALGAALATGAIAFVVAIAVITTADLVSGGSVGRGSGGTTLFGGGGRDGADEPQREEEQDRPAGESPARPDQTEQPAPEEPAPEEAAPAEPAPEEPAPEEPAPGEPAPTEPLPEVPTP